jgi:RND family efflux transporter MFP subunit
MTRVLLVVATLATFAAACGRTADEAEQPTLVASVTTAAASQRTFPVEVPGTGTIDGLPESVRVVESSLGGRVTRISVVVGAAVQRGDVVCELEPEPGARAEIRRLDRSLAQAERNVERQRLGLAAGVTPRVQLEQAELEAANLRSELAARTRDWDRARDRIVVRSPIPGLVTAVDGRVGQLVDATTPLATIVDPADLAANVRFDAPSAGRLAAGQKAHVTPVGQSDAPRAAVVLRAVHVVDPTSQQVQAWLRVDGPPLPPGMFLRASVQVGVESAVAVPRSALVKTDHGFRVFVTAGDVVHARDVEVGPADGDDVALRSGVSSGEMVVVGGAQELADGMRIRAVPAA